MTTKKLTSRQVNWAELLTKFNFLIRYRPGKQNTLADALSRQECQVEAQNSVKDIYRTRTLLHLDWLDPQIQEEQRNAGTVAPVDLVPQGGPEEAFTRTTLGGFALVDRLLQENRNSPELQKYRDEAQRPNSAWTVENGLLKHHGCLVVPSTDDLRTRLLDEVHRQVSTAHPGRNKTRRLLRSRYYWPGIGKDLDRYIANCHTCRRSMAPRDRPPGLLKPLPIPQRPWQHVSMDFQSFPKDKHGYDTIFVVVDRLGKRSYSIPCYKKTTAKDMAHLYINHIY
jgi:hypothetical protein